MRKQTEQMVRMGDGESPRVSTFLLVQFVLGPGDEKQLESRESGDEKNSDDVRQI